MKSPGHGEGATAGDNLHRISRMADDLNRSLVRDVLAAVAFLYSDQLAETSQERLADADDVLCDRVIRLVGLRQSTSAKPEGERRG